MEAEVRLWWWIPRIPLLTLPAENVTQRKQVSDCAEVLRKVLDALVKCAPKDGNKVKNFGKALSWPMSKQDTVDMMQCLSRHKSTFILALSADTMFDTRFLLHALN